MTLIRPGALMRPAQPIDPVLLRSLDGSEVAVPQVGVVYIEPNLAAGLVGSIIQGTVAALLPQILASRRGSKPDDGSADAAGALGITDDPLAARLAVHAASLRTAASMQQDPDAAPLITLTPENCEDLAKLLDEAVDALNNAPR